MRRPVLPRGLDAPPPPGAVVRDDRAQHRQQRLLRDGVAFAERDGPCGHVVMTRRDDALRVGHDRAVLEDQVQVVLRGQQAADRVVEHEVRAHPTLHGLPDLRIRLVHEVTQPLTQPPLPVRQAGQVLVDARMPFVRARAVSRRAAGSIVQAHSLRDTAAATVCRMDAAYRVTEIDQVSEELAAALAALVPQLSASSAAPDRDQWQAIASAEATRLLVAESAEGRPVGMLTLAVFAIPTGVRAWIEDVVVDQDVRGGGVGALLVRRALDLAFESGARTVDLTSRPSREAANRLYQRLGFELRQTNVYRFTARRG